MCGRFALKLLSNFLDDFPWILPPTNVPTGGGDGRYNIAPTQPVAAVLGGAEPPHVEFVRWGLVPSWAKDPSVGNRMINARAETLHERPAFKRLVASRRCLVPADGFYEWKTVGKTKTPYYVRLRSGRPFALAGLWDQWVDPDTGSPLKTCTIITAEPNELVAALHTRMAVIVRPDDYRRWLRSDPLSPDDLATMLTPSPAESMEAYPVAPAVNSPRSAGAALAERVELQPSLF